MKRIVWVSLVCIPCMLKCTDDPKCESGKNLDCGTVPWNESSYKLPYPKGASYRVNQGNNNTCGGHQGSYKYGYDFDMPVGSVIVASRAGVVSEIRTNNPDGVNLVLGNENLVKILHDDGTTAGYSHMKQFSIVVALDQVVQQGDTLGLSGNSGYTDNFPHPIFMYPRVMNQPYPDVQRYWSNFEIHNQPLWVNSKSGLRSLVDR